MIRWLRVQTLLIDHTLAAMGRRKARNLGLVAVYTAIIFVLASVSLFTGALRADATRALAHAPEVTVQRMVMGRHDLIDDSHLAALRAIRGVQWAEGRLWGYFNDTANGANYTLMVPPAGRGGADLGAAPPAGFARVGAGVARARGIEAGGWLFLVNPRGRLVKLRVQDLFPAESDLVSADLVVLSEADFRGFYDLPPGLYTDLALGVRNAREIATVVEKAALALPDSRFVTRQDILRTYDALFDWREGILLALMGGAILAFMILAWDKASGQSPDERREIGILKAIGWETGEVIRARLWESALVSLVSFLAGVALAYLHVFHFSAGLLRPVLQGWAVLYPDIHLTPRIDAAGMATLFLLTVVPYVAATLVPIWRAAIVDPDTVMR